MSTNPNYKPSEGKREEFRKYLEKNGVMDALTKVLVSLYEEVDKPQDALAFIRDKLSTEAGLETFDQMNDKVLELQSKCKELEDTIAQLTAETVPPEDQPAPEPVEGEEPPLAPEEEAAPPPAVEETPAPAPDDAPPPPPPEA